MATTKTYDLRASAVRAAKKAGLTPEQVDVFQVKDEEGKHRWTFTVKVAAQPVDNAPAAALAPKAKAKTSTPVVDDRPTRKLVIEDYRDQPPVPAPVATPEPAPVKLEATKPSKSTVENPTRAVWAVADEMTKADPKVSRKEVIYECMRRGIAYYTARTQYQRWRTARRATVA